MGKQISPKSSHHTHTQRKPRQETLLRRHREATEKQVSRQIRRRRISTPCTNRTEKEKERKTQIIQSTSADQKRKKRTEPLESNRINQINSPCCAPPVLIQWTEEEEEDTQQFGQHWILSLLLLLR